MMEPLGILNLLKPPGMTSAAAVAIVRRLLNGAKVGHAGTLDPEASGVLPLMVGKATRLFDYMQDKEKTYITEVAFTGATDTEDAQGHLTLPGNGCPTEAELLSVLPRFIGEILQRPPMFSALKQDGKRMYSLARKGEEVELPARPVTVFALDLISMTDRGALLKVRCSKGFYVRSLCRDLGIACGHPAHMRFLLRAQTGPFTLDTARTLEELEKAVQCGENILLPCEAALPNLPMTDIPAWLETPVRNGGIIPWKAFRLLHGTPAEEGAPFGLRHHGMFCAIASREEDRVKVHTWLNTFSEDHI